MPLFARLYDSTRKGRCSTACRQESPPRPNRWSRQLERVVVIKDAKATVNQPRGAVCAPAPSRDR